MYRRVWLFGKKAGLRGPVRHSASCLRAASNASSPVALAFGLAFPFALTFAFALALAFPAVAALGVVALGVAALGVAALGVAAARTSNSP